MTKTECPNDENGQRVAFMAQFAHEARSLLASLQGYAEFVADSNLRVDSSSLESFGKIIFQQAVLLGKLVDDGLTATRLMEDQLDFVLKPIRLGPLLEAVIGEIQEHQRRKILYQGDLKQVMVIGDALRLRDAIARVIDHSLRCSKSDPTIHASLKNESAAKWVEIQVAVHGMCLEDADLQALLQPFGQIKNDRTKDISGTGLSWFIVNAVVERHHGKITARPQPGEGTTFVIDLPVGEMES